MTDSRKLTLRCPECDADLVIDAATGEILFHRKAKEPPAGGQTFESLFETMDRQKADAEATFEREVKAHEDRDRLLSEKFEEALKRAREDPDDETPVPRPFDLD